MEWRWSLKHRNFYRKSTTTLTACAVLTGAGLAGFSVEPAAVSAAGVTSLTKIDTSTYKIPSDYAWSWQFIPNETTVSYSSGFKLSPSNLNFVESRGIHLTMDSQWLNPPAPCYILELQGNGWYSNPEWFRYNNVGTWNGIVVDLRIDIQSSNNLSPRDSSNPPSIAFSSEDLRILQTRDTRENTYLSYNFVQHGTNKPMPDDFKWHATLHDIDGKTSQGTYPNSSTTYSTQESLTLISDNVKLALISNTNNALQARMNARFTDSLTIVNESNAMTSNDDINGTVTICGQGSVLDYSYDIDAFGSYPGNREWFQHFWTGDTMAKIDSPPVYKNVTATSAADDKSISYNSSSPWIRYEISSYIPEASAGQYYPQIKFEDTLPAYLNARDADTLASSIIYRVDSHSVTGMIDEADKWAALKDWNISCANNKITITAKDPSQAALYGHTYSFNFAVDVDKTKIPADGILRNTATLTTFNKTTSKETQTPVLYRISTYASNGTITDSIKDAATGSSHTITFRPDQGYKLSSIFLDGESLDVNDFNSKSEDSYTFSNINANHTIQVFYAPEYFTITTNAINGTIDSNQRNIAYGTSKTIHYSPKTGYRLKRVTVDGSNVDISKYPSEYTFDNISADHEIEVEYEREEFAISTKAINGSISESIQKILLGENKTITYTPNEGYHLIRVTVDGINQTIQNCLNEFTFSNVAADHEIEVEYEINKYQVQTSVTNGTIDPSQSDIPYGSNVSYGFAPNEGYHLASVKVDGVEQPLDPACDHVDFNAISADHTVEVVYEINRYNITTNVINGTIDPSLLNQPYGSSHTITYQPHTGYYLKRVTIDGVDQDLSLYPNLAVFSNLTSDHTVEVEYALKHFNVTTNAINGLIDPGQTDIPFGTDTVYHFTPNTGHHLVRVSIDGVEQPYDPDCGEVTIPAIDADHSIEVEYDINRYDVRTSVVNGSIDDSEFAIPYGDSRTITYTPNEGYELASVVIDGTPQNISDYPEQVVFENIQANHRVDVIYRIQKFGLTTNVINGTITDSETGIPYGEDRSVSYSPNTGYHLKRITMDGIDQDLAVFGGGIDFTSITSNHSVEVEYEIDRFEILTNVINGSITDPESGIPYGDDRTITFTPNEGYILARVTIDGVDQDISDMPENSVFENIQADHTIEVEYVLKEYLITTNCINGTIDENQFGIPHGSDKTISYKPQEGYEIVRVTIDGENVDPAEFEQSANFSNITDDHEIEVEYAIKSFNISTNVINGVIDEGCQANWGDEKIINYTPNTGFRLVRVSVDGVDVNLDEYPQSYTFSDIQSDHEIEVEYQKEEAPQPEPEPIPDPTPPATPKPTPEPEPTPTPKTSVFDASWIFGAAGTGAGLAGILSALKLKRRHR